MNKNFKLHLKQMHPGVAEMDAVYQFYCEYGDRILEKTGDPLFMLYTNDKDIKINGSDVLVPYSVRQEKRKVIITAELTDYLDKECKDIITDKYVLDFNLTFSDAPSFFDDFETYDKNKWTGGSASWEYGEACTDGFVENSDMVFRLTKEDQGKIITTANTFSQTYGCFSASIKFPEMRNSACGSNAAFWLCSNVLKPDKIMFKRNPKVSEPFGRAHAGEIDIIEYSPSFGDFGTSSYHHFGWGDYHINSGMGEIPMPGIREGYHTVSLVWIPDALYWYYDGKLTRVYDQEGIKDAGKELGGDMVILLQSCVHGFLDEKNKFTGEKTWIGKTREEDFPIEMRTDWVKVHSLK